MRHLPTVLLVLALPVGLIGYFVGAAVVNAVAPSAGIITIFVSLLVAGLFMIPFIAPWLDRKAKADLAAIQERRRAEALEAGAGETPGDQSGS